MKKFQLLPMLFVIAIIILVKVANAQTSFHAPKTFKTTTTNDVLDTKTTELKVSKAAMDFRIVKRFTRIFPNIQDETWVKTPQGFLVRFNENGISTSAFLNKAGFCDATIRYYDEKMLDPEIRSLVKRSYYDFSIIGVTEVTDQLYSRDSVKAYLVIIDKQDSRKIIRVVNGDMDVYQSFTKL